ncbi:conserved Plasmodium protein, unknown function [Plasmodium ovale curtisi]|uniref:HID1 domain-containing protein n=1 Tax=Plasmodium ovale curtisi TaxID=864141 RepID=A0A1A8W6F3_PLAOA|nr:conserved Plasmodium protein, unknown function [Plasmodium ovale curtisi]
MGQNSSKNIHSLLQKVSENNLREVDFYSEFLFQDDNFKSNDDFYRIKQVVDNVDNVTVLFKFLIATLRKLLQGPNDHNVDECKLCVEICLAVLPVMQYNYKKREIFDLMWRENNLEQITQGSYACNNILILHIFNFILIALFTENMSIAKGRSGTSSCIKGSNCMGGSCTENHENGYALAKNTIDIYKLWVTSLTIYEHLAYNSSCSSLNTQRGCTKSVCSKVNRFNDEKAGKKEYLPNEKNRDNGDSVTGTYNQRGDAQQYTFVNDVAQVKFCSVGEVTKAHTNSETCNRDINLELIKNRIKLLKCLLILLSSYVYYDDRNYLKEKNLYLFLFTSGDVYFSANFFLSLMTVIYDNEYNYFSFYFYNDIYLEFYNLCILVLNILIDFNPFVIEKEKKVHYINSAFDYFRHWKERPGKGKEGKHTQGRSSLTDSPNGTERRVSGSANGSAGGSTGGGATSPSASLSLSPSLDAVLYDDAPDESCFSSGGAKDLGVGGINGNGKVRRNFPSLEHVLESKRNYLNIVKRGRYQTKRSKIRRDYYQYLKKKKELSSIYSNNVFLEMLRKLKESDIQYIYKGTLNILISYKLYFENYNENILFIDNYLCLLWHLMNNNRLFIKHMKNHNSNLFLFYILYVLMSFNYHRKGEMQKLADARRRDVAIVPTVDATSRLKRHISTEEAAAIKGKNDRNMYNNEQFNNSGKCDEFTIRRIDGLIYICLFIILKISSNSVICKNLNNKYDQKIKVNSILKSAYHFDTYIDFLVYTLCMLVNDNIFFLKFERIVDMAITILTNISVYIKSMNTYSCECIINILKKILKKEWILSSQHHYYSLFLLLDFVNNILSHNLNDNYNMVYMIIKNKDVFASIHNLDQVLKSNCLFGEAPSTGLSPRSLPRNYWVPTESWLARWKNKLPLHFINSIIYELANLVEEECDEKEIINYEEVVNIIKSHCATIKNKKIPFIIRKYEKNILLTHECSTNGIDRRAGEGERKGGIGEH